MASDRHYDYFRRMLAALERELYSYASHLPSVSSEQIRQFRNTFAAVLPSNEMDKALWHLEYELRESDRIRHVVFDTLDLVRNRLLQGQRVEIGNTLAQIAADIDDLARGQFYDAFGQVMKARRHLLIQSANLTPEQVALLNGPMMSTLGLYVYEDITQFIREYRPASPPRRNSPRRRTSSRSRSRSSSRSSSNSSYGRR